MIRFSRVTWYSQITAVVLALLIFFLGFKIGVYSVEIKRIESNKELVDKTNANARSASNIDYTRCPFGPYDQLLDKETIYTNTRLGFQITMPQDWYVADEIDLSPHFYLCNESGGFIGFEIQGDLPRTYESAVEYYEQSNKVEQEYTDLILGAVVREYKVGLGGDAWPYWYYIIFESEKRAFRFAANKPIENYNFISSFQLLK
jgi:hypothetical protein